MYPYLRNAEPSIEDALKDEVVRLVMARDGLSEAAWRRLLGETRRKLGASLPRLRVVGFDD